MKTTWPTTPCLCVQTGSTMDDEKRFRFDGAEHYLKTAAEMRALFSELPEACDNTLWVAERADVTIEFGKPKLPAFPLPGGHGHLGRVPPVPHLQRGRGAATGARYPRTWSNGSSSSSALSPQWAFPTTSSSSGT